MKRVIQWLQNLRLARIFTIFLACLLIFWVQACSRPEITTQLNQPPTQLPMQNRPLDKQIRQTGEDIGRSAEEARERLTNRIQKGVEDLKEATQLDQFPTQLPTQDTRLGKQVRQMSENIGSSTEEVTEGLTKGAERGVENLKENLKNITREATRNLQ